MNPLAGLLIAISGTLMFVSTVFLATSTPFPFFDSEDDENVDLDFSGMGGNLTLEDYGTETRGWAVYTFGEYLDDDEDGFYDLCSLIEITINTEASNNSSEDSEVVRFNRKCIGGFEREDIEDMIYVGQICYDPENSSLPRCSWGNYTFESNYFVSLVQESEPSEVSFGSFLIEWFRSGLATGRSMLCGSIMLMLIGLIINLFSSEKEERNITISEANKAEWRAYSLSGQERGDDGLPKAFTRHSEKKDIYRKPRKGNRRGGVHKTGGLHLGGWTEEDSNKEYKKRVEDRRER